jgi:D-alanyl-D-alanine carboxypeptidase (penicillin-binding protein 5/6)
VFHRIKSLVTISAVSLAALALVTLPSAAQDAAFSAKAKAAYMVDGETGTVLLSQNETAVFAPASLAKLMTAEILLNSLKSGAINSQTSYLVSEHAWRTGGAPSGTSTMFAGWRTMVPVEDLLRGMIVHSGNDACMVFAEGFSGSDSAFAQLMTKRAGEIGLQHSQFVNSTGLPAEGNATSAKDMVLLSQHIHRSYPDAYPIFSQPEFLWNKITQRNKNSVLFPDLGVDGLGLGFVEGYGFSAAVSAEQNGRRIFLTLAGMDDAKLRQEEVRRVVDWGLNAFAKRRLYEARASVGEVSVYGGNISKLNVEVRDPIDVVLLKRNPERLSGRISYQWPLPAPVVAGQEVGRLSVFSGEKMLREVPVYAATDISVGSLSQRATDAILEMLFFWL